MSSHKADQVRSNSKAFNNAPAADNSNHDLKIDEECDSMDFSGPEEINQRLPSRIVDSKDKLVLSATTVDEALDTMESRNITGNKRMEVTGTKYEI